MIANLPKHTSVNVAPSLYYSKYRIKFLVSSYEPTSAEEYRQASRNITRAKRLLYKLKKDLTISYKKRSEGSSLSFFLEDDQALATFVDTLTPALEEIKGKWTLGVWYMSEGQADAAKLDAKIEYRTAPYHRKFTYRIKAKGGDDQTLDAIEAQLFSEEEIKDFYAKIEAEKKRRAGWNSIFPQETTRYGRSICGARGRMQYGRHYSNTIVFTNDESDAALVRLIMSSAAEISKAVIIS
jgi:hypothetical protein